METKIEYRDLAQKSMDLEDKISRRTFLRESLGATISAFCLVQVVKSTVECKNFVEETPKEVKMGDRYLYPCLGLCSTEEKVDLKNKSPQQRYEREGFTKWK